MTDHSDAPVEKRTAPPALAETCEGDAEATAKALDADKDGEAAVEPSEAEQPTGEEESEEEPTPEVGIDNPPTDGQQESTPKPPVAPPRPERPEVAALRRAQESHDEVEGKVIGWNNGGLHVVVDGVTAFCPRSEIEIGSPKSLESYLDQTMRFHVLRVQKRGRRVVLSRKAILQSALNEKLEVLRNAMRAGEILSGKVSSITDFGAFVDLGDVDGLVHISEISRNRVEHASEVVSVGDDVEVRVLRISDDGQRISLSMRALEPDPWDGLENRLPSGSVVEGKVEKVAKFGAFIELEPGITGLLPTSAMNLPREAQPARVYSPGKEVSVQVLSIDRRRRRISLSLEGSQVEATRADLKSYLDSQRTSGSSFGALAAAFDKAKRNDNP